MSNESALVNISPAHDELSRLEGQWEGTTKTWFDPNKLEDESPVTGTMRLILDGRFIMHEYKSSFGDKSITGIGIYGYHKELKKFQCAWADSFHNGTAIMFSEGQKEQTSFNVHGSYAYVTPDVEQYWGWRTSIDITSDDEVIIRMFNVTPEGEESRATETVYRRVR